jgi:hypothetical protein
MNTHEQRATASPLPLADGSAPSSFYYPLFELMAREHCLTLIETELAEIVRVSETLSEELRRLRRVLAPQQLAELLAARAVVDESAVFDAEGYDGGLTMERIHALSRSLQNAQDQTVSPNPKKT